MGKKPWLHLGIGICLVILLTASGCAGAGEGSSSISPQGPPTSFEPDTATTESSPAIAVEPSKEGGGDEFSFVATGATKEAFLSIHYEVATLYWDLAEAFDVVDDRQILMVETGQRFIDLGDQALALSDDEDLLVEQYGVLLMGQYGEAVTSAGEALIRAGEAVDRGDAEAFEEEFGDFLNSIIIADTDSYWVVGVHVPHPSQRPLGEDIGDLVFREQFPVPSDGAAYCVTGDTPCTGWFSDQTGSVSDPDLLTREVQRFVNKHGLPLAVVVIGDIGRRHPIPYSTELIDTWQIHAQGAEDGIMVLIALDPAVALVRQGAGEPIAADVTEISGLGHQHVAQGDTDGGILAIIEGIESGLDPS